MDLDVVDDELGSFELERLEPPNLPGRIHRFLDWLAVTPEPRTSPTMRTTTRLNNDGWLQMGDQQPESEKSKQPLDNKWTYVNDSKFALDFLSRIQPESLSQQSISSRPCDTCIELSQRGRLRSSLFELSNSSKTCRLCEILVQGYEDAGISYQKKVQIKLSRTYCRLPRLILYAGSELKPAPDIPIGIQMLLDKNTRFNLFREWLRACNEEHTCSPKSRQLPTRVLDVREPDVIRLHLTTQGDEGEYVALSHRWRSSDLHNFCTHLCNLSARQASIRFGDLPQRFQDAVTVTRQLGVQFLWIDSICIVQPHKAASDQCPRGCSGYSDWDVERDKMEQYFGSAYCTLAATSAINPDVNEGFLERPSCAESVKGLGASTNLCHVSGDFDDFYRDVEESDLNKRGWVLQERALSRRTIHFTSTQAYWECGSGGGVFRCETMVRLRNLTAGFLSDYNFPNYALVHMESNRIYLFERLFEKYSKCGLSRPTDRSVAISGLEKRLGKAFETKWRYGVFECYRHRCLLWRRRGKRMQRIDWEVPSWSWMAYTEEITYMDVPFEEVEWNMDVKGIFDAPEKAALSITLEAPAKELQLDGTDEEWGRLIAEKEEGKDVGRWLIFDQDDTADVTEIRRLRYIVMGWDRKADRSGDGPDSYVLVIKPSRDGSCAEYERIGVGSLKRRDLSIKSEWVRVT